MDEALIYRKTKRGATELTATHGALSSPSRRVLILLDGQRTLAELAELFGADSVEHIVAELEAQGFVRQVDPDNALTTQSFPTLIGEPRLAPIGPPPSRRGSTWIALSLLVAAGATAGGGYWFFLRPNRAPEPIFASAGTSDAERPIATPAGADRAPAEAPGPRELPLSGLPAVTVSQTKKDRAAAAEPAAAADIVPAVAVLPASDPAESAAQGRRPTDRGASARGASDRAASERAVPAAAATARPGPEASSQPDTGSSPAATQPLPARTAVAQSTAATSAESQPTAPGQAAAPAASGPPSTSDQGPPATVMTVGANPGAALPNAGKAPAAPLGEQVASLAPPPKPQNAPVQLHQRQHDPPEFPARAVRAKVFEGHVLARIWVTAEGRVDQVDIVKATPPRLFDDEVKRALTAWTFDPPGRPVDTTIQLDFKP